MGLGKLHKLDIADVKTKEAKTTSFLRHALEKADHHNCTVIFLGERHEQDDIDQRVTAALLNNAPLISAGNTWVYFERTLNGNPNYIPGNDFYSSVQPNQMPTLNARSEPVNKGLSRLERSNKMADDIRDLFTNGARAIYVVCGSLHALEIFDSLDKRMQSKFTYFYKLSASDQ